MPKTTITYEATQDGKHWFYITQEEFHDFLKADSFPVLATRMSVVKGDIDLNNITLKHEQS